MSTQALPLPEWKDASGRDITRGCYIAYAASAGRSAIFKFGIVTGLVSKKDTKWVQVAPAVAPSAGQPFVPAQHQQVDYLKPKVRAITAYRGIIQRSGSGTVLEHLSRMIIVEENQIPPATLKQLKEAWEGHSGDGG